MKKVMPSVSNLYDYWSGKRLSLLPSPTRWSNLPILERFPDAVLNGTDLESIVFLAGGGRSAYRIFEHRPDFLKILPGS